MPRNVVLHEDLSDSDLEPDVFEQRTVAFNGMTPQEVASYHHQRKAAQWLDSQGALYPGGYALALYAAPDNFDDYYGDIDVIHRNPTKTYELAQEFASLYGHREYTTGRAYSVWVNEGGIETMYQFVYSWNQGLEQTLSAFDFDNCKVAYDPQEQRFVVHEDLDHFLANHQLHLAPNWLDYAPPNDPSLSIPRAYKYCKRWGWVADDWSLARLTAEWRRLDSGDQYALEQLTDSGGGSMSAVMSSSSTTLAGSLNRLYDYHGLQPPAAPNDKTSGENHAVDSLL